MGSAANVRQRNIAYTAIVLCMYNYNSVSIFLFINILLINKVYLCSHVLPVRLVSADWK